MKKNIEPLSQRLKQELPYLKSEFGVASLELFGSYIRGEQESDSDLDVLVSFNESPGLFKFIHLENYLSDLLGVKVDLVMRSALKAHIGKQILSETSLV